MRLAHALLFPLVVAAPLACGCGTKDSRPQVSTALEELVAGKPSSEVTAALWKEVGEFYKQRNGKPAWVDDKYTSRQAADALQVIRSARDHGFDPEDYGESRIIQAHQALAQSDKDAPDRAARLADFDARVTASLLALGHDVAIGRTKPQTLDPRWKSRRAAPDLVGTLVRAADGHVKTWLDEMKPPHAAYAALQKAFVDLRGQQEKGGWPVVPRGTFKPGKSDPAVVILRQRLAACGQLAEDAASSSSPVYDSNLQSAVKAFQGLHALKATGIVDAATLAALNVPLTERIRQVAINLERWRWMPDDLGARHFLVNIPYFHLLARENGKTVMDIRVVVGKRGNETPIFSDEMEYVVFSPYWNIPDSIVAGETAPAVARDPGYLARNNIEILRVSKHGAHPVDAATVDWSDPGQLRELAFRQRPGDKNALGHVKFLFPNDFDVYLHDTPADSLFQRTGRAFSHGCVRVEEPETLAKYVLRDQPEWDGPKILHAMYSGNEQHVKLKEKIPVHIAYFTAWVDENGGLHFQPDVYGYDAKQVAPVGKNARLLTT
ncbi:MAG TPA: L,D-transpeptidase family protein [Vicinamibacterales bacterium]|nr:L,D-transpeptidase family protein [Vicinamibacterales bacterium]